MRQYRYPVQGRYWEFPQGAWETRPGTDPAEVARGELEEETGFRAARLDRLGFLYAANGYANQGCHLFRATGLTTGTEWRATTRSRTSKPPPIHGPRSGAMTVAARTAEIREQAFPDRPRRCISPGTGTAGGLDRLVLAALERLAPGTRAGSRIWTTFSSSAAASPGPAPGRGSQPSDG